MCGLMYFNGCHTSQKEALVPDGTRPLLGYPGIPRHYASLWIESKDLAPEIDYWWPEEKHERKLEFTDKQGQPASALVTEFRIPTPAKVTFPDALDAPAHFHSFEKDLPRLQDLDDVFEVDLDNPEVIARVAIRGGNLEVYEFNEVAVVRWTIDPPNKPMMINADQYSITLKPQATEVVFSNTSWLLDREKPIRDYDEAYADNHFRLYARIEKRRDGSGLVIPASPKDLEELEYEHAYLQRISKVERLNDSGCTGTCC
jgi:hypothetical protein